MSDNVAQEPSETIDQPIRDSNCHKRPFANDLVVSAQEEQPQLSACSKIRISHEIIFRTITAKHQQIVQESSQTQPVQTSNPDFYLTSTEDESGLSCSFSNKQSQAEVQQSQSSFKLDENSDSHQQTDQQQKEQSSEEQLEDEGKEGFGGRLFIRFEKTQEEIQADKQLQEHLIKLYTPLQYKQIFPWMTEDIKAIEEPIIRLHEEIRSFYCYIKPSKRQKQLRLAILDHIKSVIIGLYPTAQVLPFGSFACDLYLPDGDIDIVALIDHEKMGIPETKQMYCQIYKEFKRNHRSTYGDIKFISKAEIPLVKMYHKETTFSIDISLNVCSGLDQIENLKAMKRTYPEFKYLVLVLKMMLKIRKLSETFTGGVGSFLLVCMLYHYLREFHKTASLLEHQRYSLGDYLLGFMRYYFMNVDFYKKKINVRTGLLTNRKRRPFTLSMLNPLDDRVDIGRKAWRMEEVLQLFKNRVLVIKEKSFGEGESLLKQIVNPAMGEFKYYEMKQKYVSEQGEKQEQEQRYEEERQRWIQDNRTEISIKQNIQGNQNNWKQRRYYRVKKQEHLQRSQHNEKNRQSGEKDDTSSISY